MNAATYIRKAESGMPHDTVALAIIKAQVGQVAMLTEALVKYGTHHPLCEINLSTRERKVPCSCDFAAVLAVVRGERDHDPRGS